MKTNHIGKWFGWVLVAALISMGRVALAQDAPDDVVLEAPAEDDAPPVAEPPVVEPEPVPEPAPGDDAPILAPELPPVVEPGTGDEPMEPIKPPKKTPTYKGADMQSAFTGAGSSHFGISGRVNKLPAKKSVRKEKGEWKRNVELGINTASGNSELLRYNGALSAGRETDQHAIFLKAAGRYGESEKEKDTENATAEAKFQRKLTARNYVALDGNARHDQIADLAYRVRANLSLGRHIVADERVVLSAEIGPGYVAEKKGDDREGFAAGRVAQYLEILMADNWQVWESLEYVQNLEDSAVYFITAEVGLEVALTGSMTLKFSVENRYDNQPAANKKSNDLLTTTALSWSF